MRWFGDGDGDGKEDRRGVDERRRGLDERRGIEGEG